MQYQCVGCGIASPEADTLLMLIGEHGWRPLWEHGTLVRPTTEWRCSTCWAAFKEEAATHGLPSSTKMIAQAVVEDASAEVAKPDGDITPRKPG